MFLAPEHVSDLTGFKRPNLQCRELAKMGIRYYKRHDGVPKVPVSAINPAEEKTTYGDEPNFEGLNDA